MRVQIDSSEDLSSVLRVVGALYGVELTADGSASASNSTPAPAAASSGSGSPSRRRQRPAAKSTAKKSTPAKKSSSSNSSRSMSDVREWAKSHGHAVSARGPISAGVLSAYDAAH